MQLSPTIRSEYETSVKLESSLSFILFMVAMSAGRTVLNSAYPKTLTFRLEMTLASVLGRAYRATALYYAPAQTWHEDAPTEKKC